jgi:hypothetical protein
MPNIRFYRIRNSSQIEQIGYVPGKTAGLLYVKFVGVSLYVYQDVEPEVVTALLFADSAGKAFDSEVKRGGYQYEKLGPDHAAWASLLTTEQVAA